MGLALMEGWLSRVLTLGKKLIIIDPSESETETAQIGELRW